ncbi:hypothetical protein MMC21_004527 [Puttea exsequens]|nr:hypothetical protein [Puttea exsequens]
MVHYIRFLKKPKLEFHTLHALVTITTDLGEAFYSGDITLYAHVTRKGKREIPSWDPVRSKVLWISGMRNVWIKIAGLPPSNGEDFQLTVATDCTQTRNQISLKNMPEIMTAQVEVPGNRDLSTTSFLTRRYSTESGVHMHICEEIGESIARHVWDAGIAMVAFLDSVVLQKQNMTALAQTLQQTHSSGSNVLELGSGCGIVGLQAANLFPQHEVVLTDLPQAMEILTHNANLSSSRGKTEIAIVDWSEQLPRPVQQRPFDIILVSDCTYNSDSIPALVGTLYMLSEVSPSVLIVVSTKRRHESEKIFFELMDKTSFESIEHIAVALPDQTRVVAGQKLENVDIHVFKRISALVPAKLSQRSLA